MALMRMGEVFGFAVTDLGETARETRQQKHCPFRQSRCTKSDKDEPIGVCSLTDGSRLATLCPVRFLQHGRLFVDVARLAFGGGARFVAAPEVRVLRVPVEGRQDKKIGKIDFLIAQLDQNDLPVDFAALEVQAVYFSGGEIRTPMEEFLRTGVESAGSERRPDWRSSIQKRLMPQLSLKVPIFRRWGKKFFVATDSLFFAEVPPIRPVNTLANSEVTWLVYPFSKQGDGYDMGDPDLKFTTWADVETSLREGTAPEPKEVLLEVLQKKEKYKLPIRTA